MKTLLDLREENGLSQVDAAKKAGINKETWNKVENGLSTPQKRTLRKIATAFDIKPSEIATGKDHDELDDKHKPYQKDGFVVKTYGTYVPLIEKRLMYDDRRPVYIKPGVLLRHAFLEIKNSADANSFRDDAVIASPNWLDSYINLIWVNVKTGKTMYDRYFKTQRIDRAITLWNQKKDKEELPFTFINRMVSGFSNWKPIVISTELRDHLDAPLALLPSAIAGLREQDRGVAIDDAIDHVQDGKTAYDYVYEKYFVDKDDNVFSEKELVAKNVDEALKVWNDTKQSSKTNSFYKTLVKVSSKNAKHYRSFDQVYKENQGRDKWFNPFCTHTKTYDLYEDWLFDKAREDYYVSITSLIVDRLDSGAYDGEYVGYYLENGDIDVYNLADILKAIDICPKLPIISTLLERLDITFDDLRKLYKAGAIDDDEYETLNNDTMHELVKKAQEKAEEDGAQSDLSNH